MARIISVRRPRSIPTAVALDNRELAGLPGRSWILCHDLATLVADDPIEVIDRLSPLRMVDVEDALRATLEL
ncbi:MAG: type II toxin-antitoxin system PemK/MazF family toxin [Solirubrobacteraceae bacterium]